MELIIRREIQRRRMRGEVKKGIDQMSSSWKTPGGYLFHSSRDTEKEVEIEKKLRGYYWK